LKRFLNVRGGLSILGLDSQAIEAAISARYRGELKATEFMDMTSEEEPPVPPGLRTLVTDETAAKGVLELFERDLYSTEASR